MKLEKIIIIGRNDHARSILDILSRNDLLNRKYEYVDKKKY
jgi:hypothetical protein